MTGDTIAAVAPAAGRGAVAVLRVSGPNAADVAAALTVAPAAPPAPPGSADAALEPRSATLRRIVHPETGDVLDHSLVTWYPAPGSYTGEDMLEISTHGGAVVPSLVLDAACAAGARPAGPGEFTRRAYLNGKLDLVQAEATLDLIDARSTRMGAAALFALERGLSQRVEALREASIELQALIAYDIDFPDEDDGPLDPERVSRAAADLDARLEDLLRHAGEGELLREGALTVVAGLPNAGKSSLFNTLLGVERAIVTEEPGTTRDAIEAILSVDGYPFRLVDTAGIREDAARIEGLGIEVARSYLRRAELVIVCVEAGRTPNDDERAFVRELDEELGRRRVVLVRTKLDATDGVRGRVRADGEASASSGSPGSRPGGTKGTGAAAELPGELPVSAHTGEGLDGLRAVLLGAAFGGLTRSDEQPLVTRRRHARALQSARAAVGEFRRAWSDGHPPEIAATHLQDAVLALEEILGVVTTEDVLDVLFSSFCVGK